jgi:hypothetical protein
MLGFLASLMPALGESQGMSMQELVPPVRRLQLQATDEQHQNKLTVHLRHI